MKEFLLNIILAIDCHIIEFIKIPENINSNKQSLKELSNIIMRCKENSILVGILGSWALTIHLGKEFRKIDDIDLMTDDASFERLEKLLLTLSYKKVSSKWPNMHCFTKNGVRIDVYSVNDKNHIFYGLPFNTENMGYQGNSYPVITKRILYEMYKRVFMKPGRSIRKDLISFKVLNSI